MDQKTEKSLLLHSCCGPCASGCIGRVLSSGRGSVMYFSNSNLCDEEEYGKRLAAARTVADHFGLELIADPYDHEAWLTAVQGLENEPERGARCSACFRFSLTRTAEMAQRLGMSFATTLTVSPHKNSAVIFDIGAAWEHFEPWDFKKKEGFRLSIENSRELGLYRQNFCGCEFSRNHTNTNHEKGKTE